MLDGIRSNPDRPSDHVVALTGEAVLDLGGGLDRERRHAAQPIKDLKAHSCFCSSTGVLADLPYAVGGRIELAPVCLVCDSVHLMPRFTPDEQEAAA